MPFPFYLTLLALITFGWQAWQARNRGWGIPAIIVLLTAGTWYVGDAIYNDYSEYQLQFGAEILDAAWWQVLWFVTVFGLIAPRVSQRINKDLKAERSHILQLVRQDRVVAGKFQFQLDRIAKSLFWSWLVLMAVALTRVQYDFIGLFFPYLGPKAEPWARDRIGGGFDALLSLSAYIQVFLVASFGVVAALAINPKTRSIALAVCFLSLPYYLFERTRNTILATVIPGFLSWALLRVRGGIIAKAAILLSGFLVVNGWMSFVIKARGDGVSVAGAFRSGSVTHNEGKVKHEGLNMFEELSYINYFIENGSYLPNWGARYFAEIANPVPRVIWKDKPEIGIDYALARGMGSSHASDSSGGIVASISTGMIGQGVVNFGRFLGPAASAFLMSLWVSLLARQDLLGAHPARLLLYATGTILTFNMGRDITLLVMYPFIFGLSLIWVWQRIGGQEMPKSGRPKRKPPGCAIAAKARRS